MRHRSFNKYFRVLLLIVSVITLFFLLKYIGFNKVDEAFQSIGLKGALIITIFGFSENFFDALALKYSFIKKLPILKVWVLNCAGSIVNTVIPWDAGEVVKGTLVSKFLTLSESISGIVLWNYFHKLSRSLSLVFIVVVSLIFGTDLNSALLWIVIVVVAISFVPYLFMKLLINAEISHKLLKFLSSFWKKDYSNLIKKTKKLDKTLKNFKKENPHNFKRVFLFQFSARIISWLTFVVVAFMVGFDAPFAEVSLLYCAVNLGMYIFSIIPVKIGVGEGASYVIFSFFGFDGGIGLLITFILRLKAIFTLGVLSLFVGTLFNNTKVNVCDREKE
ncbi:MAG: hypothetical protein DRP93_09015 [Candidatus Neomarinimicrobiota bacterium]|nr:MAG: hypothetical protein DRP93_09015 [Candidatus Neomarinimicrobiota bacterium]